MKTKLTLTIDENTISRAKRFAKLKERSLSDIVENYLRALTCDKEDSASEITPLVKSLKGSFSKNFKSDYKEELARILEEKYLER